MSPKMAKQWRLPAGTLPSSMVRLDVGKNNLAPPRDEPLWFKRESVWLGGKEDGESVGILRPFKLDKGFVAKTDGLDALTRVLRGCLPTGVWHSFNAVRAAFTPDEQALFADDKNRGRALDEAFDDLPEQVVEGGKLSREKQKGKWHFRYVPHDPQNGAEEHTTH
jgi:hypothetical protein